jgi:galactokinase
MTPPSLHTRVEQAFTQAHGGAPTLWVRAPGRVNLIGEHTDYNGGFVLPCAIDRQTLVAARPRSDGQLRVVAADFGGATDAFGVQAPVPHHASAPWANYVRGVVAVLQAELAARGLVLQGADLAIAGDVPQGAGLSSSASLEVAVLHTLNTLQGLGLGLARPAMALLAQRAENSFVGCQCGVMDQMISACGEAGHALLIDCRSLQTRAVPLPAGLAVVIVHSRVQRGLVDSAYNERRRQCEAAAAHYGVPALRDLGLAPLRDGVEGLDALTYRRARHIVTENQRTLDAAEALAAGDLRRLGALMAASHASMRDDFEITHPAVDELVAIAQAAIGTEGGARMTGGGFGGCVVALLPQARVPALQAHIAAEYRAPGGEPATVWVCQAAGGVGAV